KYLQVFSDFKVVRSFFDSSTAAVSIVPDPFKIPGTNGPFSPRAFSVPIQNPFNPFTVADATIPNFFPDGSGLPVNTGVQFRGVNDTGPRHEKFTYHDNLFDVGLRGEMGEFGDYFKTWNWETGFRYSRNEGQHLSTGAVSEPGLREALLDTDPATAFDPFLNSNAHNTKAARARVYERIKCRSWICIQECFPQSRLADYTGRQVLPLVPRVTETSFPVPRLEIIAKFTHLAPQTNIK